ncbi:hypothetical protein NY78_2110 [Desulfovibrio sp. TomC]|nr:hypothetical protein NY78_2110 [Desulfovibrio sp. TomC]
MHGLRPPTRQSPGQTTRPYQGGYPACPAPPVGRCQAWQAGAGDCRSRPQHHFGRSSQAPALTSSQPAAGNQPPARAKTS